VIAGNIREGAALGYVISFGVVSASHWVGKNERWGRCSGLCSLGWHGLSQPLRWLSQKLRALLWSLFALSAWAHTATVVSGTIVGSAALPSVRIIVLATDSHCTGGLDI
jgi:hypothetical protein